MKFDAVIIGAGLSGLTAALALQQKGLQCAVVGEGLSLHKCPRSEFIAAGGTLLPGDSVTGGAIEDGHLLSCRTRNLGDTLLEARFFVLATGKFFSRGLISDMQHVYEPVFGCDVDYDPDPVKWVNRDFFGPQPFETFGVRTDDKSRVSVDGVTIDNLFAAGEILSGTPDIVQSALKVAETIISLN